MKKLEIMQKKKSMHALYSYLIIVRDLHSGQFSILPIGLPIDLEFRNLHKRFPPSV